jgi:hypothetical protein
MDSELLVYESLFANPELANPTWGVTSNGTEN